MVKIYLHAMLEITAGHHLQGRRDRAYTDRQRLRRAGCENRRIQILLLRQGLSRKYKGGLGRGEQRRGEQRLLPLRNALRRQLFQRPALQVRRQGTRPHQRSRHIVPLSLFAPQDAKICFCSRFVLSLPYS